MEQQPIGSVAARPAVQRLLDRLRAAGLGDRLIEMAPMSEYTSFRIGGPAEVLLRAAGPGDIMAALGAAADLEVPYLVMGLGTNLLVLDGGIRGLVVRVGPELNHLEWDHHQVAVTAGAGIELAKLSAAAADLGWSGLEWAEGVPGTLGGALVMNAGAYGGDISQSVQWAEVVEGGRGTRRLPAAELGWGYRRSSLQGSGLVVTAARLGLRPDRPEAIWARMSDLARRRRERQPLEYPSAGSFFMRPGGRYVGPMIEDCGLKGLRRGGAQVSSKHANFIINVGGATARDVLALAEEVRRAVKQRYGVDLEAEVKVVGEPGEPAPPSGPVAGTGD